MKKSTQLTFFLLVLTINSFAQAHSGIYVSASDYKNNQLKYDAECKTKHGGNIHLHDFLGNGTFVTVNTNGNKLKLRKSEIYGFRNCENEVYRFYNNAAYRILESKGIVIYTGTETVQQSKGFKIVNRYFFSATPESELMYLTIDNIKNAFRTNDKMLDLVDQFFKGADITEYDDIHKMYKVNYVYNKSIR